MDDLNPFKCIGVVFWPLLHWHNTQGYSSDCPNLKTTEVTVKKGSHISKVYSGRWDQKPGRGCQGGYLRQVWPGWRQEMKYCAWPNLVLQTVLVKLGVVSKNGHTKQVHGSPVGCKHAGFNETAGFSCVWLDNYSLHQRWWNGLQEVHFRADSVVYRK